MESRLARYTIFVFSLKLYKKPSLQTLESVRHRRDCRLAYPDPSSLVSHPLPFERRSSTRYSVSARTAQPHRPRRRRVTRRPHVARVLYLDTLGTNASLHSTAYTTVRVATSSDTLTTETYKALSLSTQNQPSEHLFHLTRTAQPHSTTVLSAERPDVASGCHAGLHSISKRSSS